MVSLGLISSKLSYHLIYINSICVFILVCLITCLTCFTVCCRVASLPAVFVRVTWHVYFQIMHHLWKKHVSGPPVWNATNHSATPLTSPRHLINPALPTPPAYRSAPNWDRCWPLGLCFGLLGLMEEEEEEGGWVFTGTAASIDTHVWKGLFVAVFVFLTGAPAPALAQFARRLPGSCNSFDKELR